MEGQFQRGKREVDACAMTLARRGPDIHLGNTRLASKINQVLTLLTYNISYVQGMSWVVQGIIPDTK